MISPHGRVTSPGMIPGNLLDSTSIPGTYTITCGWPATEGDSVIVGANPENPTGITVVFYAATENPSYVTAGWQANLLEESAAGLAAAVVEEMTVYGYAVTAEGAVATVTGVTSVTETGSTFTVAQA